ncbi:MAG: fimbrial protein [Gammaproteobacteria bacterium]|nr:fimbrial protein [Gammaproteobacteria bacterium]
MLLSARSPAAAAAEPQVEFNAAFLQGGSQVDVSRFSRGNPVLPGDYMVDLQINGKWMGRASVRFIAQPNSDIALPCIDRALIGRIGLDFEKLSASARATLQKAQSAGCVDLKAMIADAAVSFDLSQLRLDISIPQAAMLRKPRGYVGPEFWDSGVPSATLGYNLNAYRSATPELTTTVGHLDLTAGINFDSWHLRQRSSLEVTSGQPSSYQNIATYLAHDIPSIRSDLTVGDSFTDGAVFDSFGFRGVSLASDDQMLPDSQLEYAPIVHGIARTNARVVVTQNGNTILETTVSPGAFEINDLYATGYGGDLHVTVYEADGSQNSFIVPYASLVQLLRPGVWRYTTVAGEVKQPSLTGTERFTQATVQHGFNSYLTGYTGAVGAEHYAAGLLGIAVNTVVGALAADVTEARAAITDTYSSTGQSLRFSYSKLVRDTRTNITLATYRYSSSGYYSFSDAQQASAAARASSTPDTVERARSQWLVNINQTLPGRWGNFYLSASVRDYWQSSGTKTQFQGGYTNHFRVGGISLSYSISVARENNATTGQPDNRVQANFSLPLGHSPHSPMLSTSFNQETTGGVRTHGGQEVINGTWGENNQLSYSASASQTSGKDSFTANGQYRSTYASMSASVSEGSGYSQQSVGTTGGVVLHPGGITLANQMTDTIGIVEAIGAEGARVTNNVGTTINRSGYAVLPFLLPYRLNSININPDDTVSADVEFKSTSESIAPRLNSVVMIRFQTVGGRPILITAHRADGSVVPFGASVYDAQGSEVGLAGQDGGIYLRGIAESGALTARWGDAPDEQCAFEYRLPPKHKGDGPFVRIDATCNVGVASPNKHNDSDQAALDRVTGQQ